LVGGITGEDAVEERSIVLCYTTKKVMRMNKERKGEE